VPLDRIVVPEALAAFHLKYFGEAGRAWSAALPDVAADYLRRWDLRLDGPPQHGVVGLVLPVLRVDDTPAVLKLQPIDDESSGEAAALRAWDGDGAVRLLADDPVTGTLLLERLAVDRSLADLPDEMKATQIIAELLARLSSHAAPPHLRRLSDIAATMIADTPQAVRSLADAGEARLVRRWADAVSEVVGEAGDQLLHWDLHYENVLAADREPWLAIDPKPLAGDPAFELLPALHNRWEEIVASGDPARAVLRRFDLMVEMLGLGRDRAVAWSLARVLQNALWDVKDGEHAVNSAQLLIAEAFAGPRPA
jgi:streptomycin 6-kinase